MKKYFTRVLAGLLSLTLLAACSPSEKAAESKQTKEGKIKVYTSIYPIYDLTQKIGGDKIENTLLVPMGQEAHDYEPTAKQMADLQGADLVVINGVGIESWSEKVKDANPNLNFCVASDGIEMIKGHHHHHHHHDGEEAEEEHDHDHEHATEAEHNHEHDHEHEHANEAEHNHDHEHEHATEAEHNHDHEHATEAEHEHDHEHATEAEHIHDHEHGDGDEKAETHTLDPHVWTSPSLALKEMENIKEALVKVDPKNADYYKANYDKYKVEFEKLIEDYKTGLKDIKKKDIIVSHEAFGYLCKEFGLKQIGLESLVPESEPSPQKMAEVTDYIKKEGVKVIFFESDSTSKVADTLAKETGVKTMVLNTLESLTDEEVKNGDEYISIMRKNLEALKEALN